LDDQTAFYLSHRASFFYTIIKKDKGFLASGEELLGEVDNFIKKYHQFDRLGERLYWVKSEVLQMMGSVDEQYVQKHVEFVAERKELIRQNEDRLQSALWYTWLYPDINLGRPYDTPEQLAEASRLIDKFQYLIDTNAKTKRFDAEGIELLYRWLRNLFHSSVFGDSANLPKLQVFIDKLEKAALEKKDDPLLNKALFDSYQTLWNKKEYDFGNDGGSDDDLILIFDTKMKYLDVAPDNAYGGAGRWLSGVLLDSTPAFDKCTPEQRGLFTNRLEQVIAKMEVMEKAYKEAGNPMMRESYVEPLRSYLGYLRLPGTVITFTGQTVEGKPFDAESLRGKIVLLDFWATTCGPCIAKMPVLKEYYEAFHARGFEIVGISINVEEDKAKLVEFVRSRQLPWIQLHDPKSELLHQLHGRGVSYCLLLDREGKVILHDAEARGEALTRKLAELFPAE
jgi:thiol-disulfide isomerase/thioredoxin